MTRVVYSYKAGGSGKLFPPEALGILQVSGVACVGISDSYELV